MHFSSPCVPQTPHSYFILRLFLCYSIFSISPTSHSNQAHLQMKRVPLNSSQHIQINYDFTLVWCLPHLWDCHAVLTVRQFRQLLGSSRMARMWIYLPKNWIHLVKNMNQWQLFVETVMNLRLP